MIINCLEANKMNFKTHCFVYKQSLTGLFNYIELHCFVFYDVNITILQFDRSIAAEFTKGFSRPTALFTNKA